MCTEIYQIIDININRITGSLRILEDYFRTCTSHKNISLLLKEFRHDINIVFDIQKCILSRDTFSDNGKFLNTSSELNKKSLFQLLISNTRRINECMRVLEEYSKLIQENTKKIKYLRFEFYNIEKKIVKLIVEVQNVEQNCSKGKDRPRDFKTKNKNR